MSELSQKQRVVVTGVGLVTPFGATREASWEAFQSGGSATRWILPEELHQPPARRDDGDKWQRFAGASARGIASPMIVAGRPYDEPVITLALQAADEALHDAGLLADAGDRTRFGSVVGTSKGGLHSIARAMADQPAGGRGCVDLPASVWHQFPASMPSTVVAARFGLEGPCLCPVAACATGLLSLNRGFELVRDGHCDVVLAGSSDASLCTSVLASFNRLGVLARGFDDPATACRPFDRTRNGFAVGEGAAMLVFERLDHAAARNAPTYAEWVTSGYAADVSGLTQLEEKPQGLVRLIRDVLKRAALTSAELDYVNLHGTATRPNDRCETIAIKQACGAAARYLRCSGLKGGAGHMLGAAGSVETATTLLAMRDGIIPPTVNLTDPDDGCDLDYTPRIAQPQRIENALKLSLGFGGHLVAAVLRETAS